jgi:hypothetical protein
MGLIWTCPETNTRLVAFLMGLSWHMAGVCHSIKAFFSAFVEKHECDFDYPK